MIDTAVFIVFSLLTLFSGLGLFLHPKPLLSLLHLLAVIFSVSGLMLTMNAILLAFVCLIFGGSGTLVFILFASLSRNLNFTEQQVFSGSVFSNIIKILFSGTFAGLLFFSILYKTNRYGYLDPEPNSLQFGPKMISMDFLSNYFIHGQILFLLLATLSLGLIFHMKRMD